MHAAAYGGACRLLDVRRVRFLQRIFAEKTVVGAATLHFLESAGQRGVEGCVVLRHAETDHDREEQPLRTDDKPAVKVVGDQLGHGILEHRVRCLGKKRLSGLRRGRKFQDLNRLPASLAAFTLREGFELGRPRRALHGTDPLAAQVDEVHRARGRRRGHQDGTAGFQVRNVPDDLRALRRDIERRGHHVDAMRIEPGYEAGEARVDELRLHPGGARQGAHEFRIEAGRQALFEVGVGGIGEIRADPQFAGGLGIGGLRHRHRHEQRGTSQRDLRYPGSCQPVHLVIPVPFGRSPAIGGPRSGGRTGSRASSASLRRRRFTWARRLSSSSHRRDRLCRHISREADTGRSGGGS